MALNTTQLRAEWGPNCTPTSQLAGIALWTGVKVTVRQGTEAAWAALDQVLEHYGYRPIAGQTGAYNCRPITGGTGLSLHSFGIALDLNWTENPYSTTKYVTDMPAAMVQAVRAIRTNSGAQVFVSGADFDNNGVLGDHGPFDAMHFQICCTKAQLATGINPATVPGSQPAPPPAPPEDEDMPQTQYVDGVAIVNPSPGRIDRFRINAQRLEQSFSTDGGKTFTDWQRPPGTTDDSYKLAGDLIVIADGKGGYYVEGLGVDDPAHRYATVWSGGPAWSPFAATP